MTIFTPTLFAALFKAAAFMGAAGEAPAPQEAAPVEAPAEPAGSAKAPPTGVSQPEKVPLAEPLPAIEVEPETVPRPVTETPAPKVETIAPGMPREEVIANVRTALSDVTTAKGRFEQINPDGSVVTGSYALSRPGRVRFEYDAPVPLLIVADGTNVAQIDRELEETETVPIAATPLNAILGGEGSFDARAEVTAVNQGRGFAAVTVVDPNREYEGSLTLLFDMADWSLEQWTTVDSIGAITVVRLLETETGAALDPRLFRVEDMRDDRDRDRRGR